ncbi:MAG: 6-carboxytetrahydropterin synthase QueD [Desulfuromonas sp.]|nr:MAG: 6-carboxytetrahydropterin synthase QueD [Desulfuromonas sp.]
MYRLKIYTHFAAAHNLINYDGDCENLHGHNWKVDVTVQAIELDKSGLGIDFKVLKARTKELLGTLDHKYLNDLAPFKEASPSSENIARYLFESLEKMLNSDNVAVESVNVWESDNACASYSRD